MIKISSQQNKKINGFRKLLQFRAIAQEDKMKKTILGLITLLSLAANSAEYNNTAFCEAASDFNTQEAFRSIMDDNQDRSDGVDKILSRVCDESLHRLRDSNSYCEDMAKLLDDELVITTSEDYIDDINAAKTMDAIIDSKKILDETCK